MRDRIVLATAVAAPTAEIPETHFRPAARHQESLLAPLERRCLRWLAVRMPKAITPDHLTALGLVALVLAGGCYALARVWPPALLIVNIWLAVNWFGDSLDGTLARVREKQRPRYGFYVDHVVDAVGALFVLGGFAVSGYATPVVALAMLVGFLLLSIEAYLATYTIGTFKLSHGWFSPTELRILLAVGNAYAWWKPQVTLFGHRMLFFDVGFAVGVVCVLATFVVAVARNTRALYRAERV